MGGGTVRYPSAAGSVRVGARRPGKTKKRPVSAGPSAATYWRRRFVVLVVGLSAVAAAGWSVSDAFTVQPDPKAPATSHGARGGSGQDGGAAGRGGGQQGGGTGQGGSGAGGQGGGTGHGGSGAGGQGGGTGHGGGSPSAGATGTSSDSPSEPPGEDARTQPAHQGGTGTSPKPSPSPSASGGSGPKACPRQAVVVSLRQVKVAAGRRPTFNVSVVSTQRADCSFNIGAGHLALVIKRSQVRVWSSADCVAGTGGLVTVLRRGVPTVVTIGWSKKTSSPRCDGHARSVAPGVFQAYAQDGSLTSTPVRFRLG
jgi:hypothetical protein